MARRYARDNKGRFASTGSGATARGGRLKTASGAKRQSQTMQASAAPKGTIGKPRGLKPGAIQARAAAKPASKPAAKGRGQVSSEKALRVSQRINNVTNAASTKSGVKRLNATEVGVRAKAFATRKVGGMSGTAGMNFQQQQAAVRAGLSKPPRYSTQKPNRNKPLRYNALGQDKARVDARLASQTARERIAAATAKPAKPAPPSRRRLLGRRELVGSRMGAGNAPVTAKGSRIGSTVKRPAPAKPPSMAVRTRKQSKAAQRFRREGILTRTRQPGPIGLGGTRNNPRIQKQQTGMSQLSLIGKPRALVRFRRK